MSRPAISGGREVRHLALDDLGDVDGAVADVHPLLDPAVEPADGAAQERGAQRARLRLDPVELVRVPARLQAEAPDEVEVVGAEQVQGEDAARLDEFPGVVLTRQGRPGRAAGRARWTPG